MAIEIKRIPILKSKVAFEFIARAKENYKKKHSIDFSKQLEISTKILQKAKL